MLSCHPSGTVPTNRLRGHLHHRLGHEGSRYETSNLRAYRTGSHFNYGPQ